MKQFKNIFVAFCCFVLSNSLFSQQVEMADTMRANGKIYVVVGVLTLVFIGLIVYLIMQDSRISKLEKKLKN